MNYQEAASILSDRMSIRGDFSEKVLYNIGWYLFAEAGKTEATLDGEFTADQLEAIAVWMRDPVGVRSALVDSKA